MLWRQLVTRRAGDISRPGQARKPRPPRGPPAHTGALGPQGYSWECLPAPAHRRTAQVMVSPRSKYGHSDLRLLASFRSSSSVFGLRRFVRTRCRITAISHPTMVQSLSSIALPRSHPHLNMVGTMVQPRARLNVDVV